MDKPLTVGRALLLVMFLLMVISTVMWGVLGVWWAAAVGGLFAAGNFMAMVSD